jgi:membrane associated rhomboid family serine protease
MIIVAHATSETAAEEMTLALASAGIISRAREHDAVWDIEVPVYAARHAEEVLRDYAPADGKPPPPSWRERWPRAGLLFAALLVLVHAGAVWQGHDSVVLRAGSSGYLLFRGEFHRCITALFVHADIEHLMSNACAIAVLMSGVAASIGTGVGALLVLLAGGAGNALSGLVRHSYRLSIGASTAVFAAIGILAARQFFEHLRVPAGRLRAWVPLGAAVALLSMLGAGPRTDLAAHLFGLVAGVAFGGLHAAVVPSRPGHLVQAIAGALATLLAFAAWSAAMAV